MHNTYNNLIIAYQNVPITSVLTDFTLGSLKDFDVGISLFHKNESFIVS